jgi:hypothetical protein
VEQGLQTLQRPVDPECAPEIEVPVEEATTSRAESTITAPTPSVDRKEPDYWADSSESTPAGAQILGVAILEFGILFHSVCPLPPGCLLMIGNHRPHISSSRRIRIYHSLHCNHLSSYVLPLLPFHQFELIRIEAFEGLGLGTRLAFLQLPPKWNWVPTVAALIYSAMTPLGMAIGLGAQGGLVCLLSSPSIP